MEPPTTEDMPPGLHVFILANSGKVFESIALGRQPPRHPPMKRRNRSVVRLHHTPEACFRPIDRPCNLAQKLPLYSFYVPPSRLTQLLQRILGPMAFRRGSHGASKRRRVEEAEEARSE
jgi:hypothetical protein